MDKKYQMILASQSPRRKELLGHVGLNFEIISSDIEEITCETDPHKVAQDLSRQKGIAVYEQIKEKIDHPLVVASDTIVTLGETIYGKPTDVEDARRILLELSGKTHQVMTGVYIGATDLERGELKEHVFSCATDVTFDEIPEDVLYHYLQTGDSLDKAGAYGIQKEGLTFISNLNGSYSNVVGFPLSNFISELKSFLGHPNDWRGLFK